MDRTFLYRLFDDADVLLYVGISGRWFDRMRAHARTKPEWDRVARVERVPYPTRKEALEAEAVAIRDERPLWNVVRPLQPIPAAPLPTTLAADSPIMRWIALNPHDHVALMHARGIGDPAPSWMSKQERLSHDQDVRRLEASYAARVAAGVDRYARDHQPEEDR